MMMRGLPKEQRLYRLDSNPQSWIVLLLLLLACSFLLLPMVDGQSSCPLCRDRSAPPDLELIINGTDCHGLAFFYASESNPARCAAIQATFGIYCGCNNTVMDDNDDDTTFCRICGNDTLLPHPTLLVPQGNGQVSSCVQIEFLANTVDLNIDGSTSCEAVQGGTQAATCCTESEPPSASPTRNPTMKPTMNPTINATMNPTMNPTMSSPTGEPTSLPSNRTTTTAPSLAPVQQSTTTVQPTGTTTALPITTTPTLSPTLPPMVQVGAFFNGITMQLTNVSALLNQTQQDNFESALQGWYASIYEEDLKTTTRLLQQQQQQQQQQHPTLRHFQTRVLYKHQQVVADKGRTIVAATYDQSLSFLQPTHQEEPVNVRNLLLEPFADPLAVRQLLDRLRASDAIFETLDESAWQPPEVPQPIMDGPTGGDNDNKTKRGLIIGIIVAGLFVVIVTLYLVVLRHCLESKQESNEKGVEESSLEKPEKIHDEKIASVKNEFSTETTPLPDPSKPEPDEEESIPHTHDYERSVVVVKPPVSLSSSSSSLSPKRARSPRPGPDEDDTPTVSMPSVRTMATVDTGSYMGVLGLESSVDDSTSHHQEPELPRQETYVVIAPPGKLGVVIDTPPEGPPTVFAVKDTSPLHGKVATGDLLIQVDDEDVSTFSAVKVSKLIGRKAKNLERKFVLSRVVLTDDDEGLHGETFDFVAASADEESGI